jgi:hypothetical protein
VENGNTDTNAGSGDSKEQQPTDGGTAETSSTAEPTSTESTTVLTQETNGNADENVRNNERTNNSDVENNNEADSSDEGEESDIFTDIGGVPTWIYAFGLLLLFNILTLVFAMLAFFKGRRCIDDVEELNNKVDSVSRFLGKQGDDKYISDKLDEIKKDIKAINNNMPSSLQDRYQESTERSEHESLDRKAANDLVARMRSKAGGARSYGAAQSNTEFSRPKTLTERYNDFINTNNGMKPAELESMNITTAGKPYIDSSRQNSVEFFVNKRADGKMEVYPIKKCISKTGFGFMHPDLFTASATGTPAVEQPAIVKQISADGELSVVQRGKITY